MIKKEVLYDDQTYYISIGRNSQENWNLIDYSNKNDIWFHLDGFSSPHVVLKNSGNNDIPSYVINECCLLCKQYSKYAKFPTNYLKIIYTSIGNLKKGTDVGSVIYISKKKNNYIVI